MPAHIDSHTHSTDLLYNGRCKQRTFFGRVNFMSQSIELPRDAVGNLLTPVLRWAEDEHRTPATHRLQTQRNHIAVVAGFSRRHRMSRGDGSQPSSQRAVVNVGTDLDHFQQRNWSEVGAVEVSVDPSSDHVKVRKRRRHADYLHWVHITASAYKHTEGGPKKSATTRLAL